MHKSPAIYGSSCKARNCSCGDRWYSTTGHRVCQVQQDHLLPAALGAADDNYCTLEFPLPLSNHEARIGVE